MATVLTQLGWRVTRLDGGYRTYRRRVQARLYDQAPDLKLVLLDGYTGSGKTEILGRLAAQGVQTLDLEGLAAHRGSLFGAVAGTPQPPQKLFETNLLAALDALDPTRPIVVEAESSRIGDIATPPLIWQAMQGAPRITLKVERSHRAAYTLSAYPDIRADPAALEAVLSRLPPRLGRARLESWRTLAAAGDFAALADGLMEHHYDPAYAVSSRRSDQPILAQIALEDLGEAEQDRAAREIAAVVAGLAARGG